MKTTVYRKLVRDRIPEIIEQAGQKCVCSVLSGDEYLKMLDEKLNEDIRTAAAELGYPLVEGTISSSDVFYIDTPEFDPNYAKYNCVCAEMESFALFHNAKQLGKKGACVLTVSDHILTHQETTAEERQTAFTKMMEIALEAALNY